MSSCTASAPGRDRDKGHGTASFNLKLTRVPEKQEGRAFQALQNPSRYQLRYSKFFVCDCYSSQIKSTAWRLLPSWFTPEHACTFLPALPLTPQTDTNINTSTSVRRVVAAVTGIQVKRQNTGTNKTWGQTVDNQG